MVAQFSQRLHPLTSAIAELPEDWRYTLVGGEKYPIVGQEWQKRPYTKQEVNEALANGFTHVDMHGKTSRKPGSRVRAIGVMCGELSGGLLCFDHDGASADALVEKLSGMPLGEALPPTVAFTSGKPGRYQLAYRIPKHFWNAIAHKVVRSDVKDEQIEFRWNGHQSVVVGAHPETEGYRWMPNRSPSQIAVADAPTWMVEQMLKAAPTVERLSDEEVARSALDALHPSRADDYDEWLKVGMALQSVSDSLFSDWDNWSRQSAKYNPKGMEAKWASFKGSGVGIGTLIHWAKSDGWKYPKSREFAAPPPAPTATNVVDHPTVRRSIDSDELRERLRAIAHSSPSGSEKRLQLAGLAKQFGCQSRELESIYAELEREMDLEEGMADAQNDLSALINARHASVPLSSVLPRKLADPLEQLAKWQNLKPENYLFSFLAGVSSLHRNGTELVIHQAMDFRVSPGLFVGIVAESSQKKSPIINASLKRPLGVLHREERKRHELAMEQWEAECSQIRQQQDKNAKLPDEPQKRVYRIDRTTGEAILRQATRQPEHGYIYNPDELKALFGSQNAYRKGRGSDEEDLLEFYDGNGGTILRADGVRDDVDCLNLAIAGSIQPGVLQKLIGEGDDSNGKWARFIFVHQPTTASSLPNDGGGVDLTNLLAGIYRTVDSAPAMEYRLSPQAFKRFQVAYDKLEQMRVNEPSQAMRAVWGKTAGRIGKIALNLHIVQWAMSTEPVPSPIIELETLEAAIALANFAARQIESLYCQFDDSDGNLAPHYLKVLELAERKGGWVKAKDIQLGFTRSKRPTPEVVRAWFGQLCEMGYGILDGEGRKLQFQKVDAGRQKVDGLSTAETTTTKASQVKVDKVDKVDHFSSTSMGNPPKDPGSSGRRENILSTPSTCLPNEQNSYPESDSSVDNPSTKVSTFPKSSTVLPPDEKVDDLVDGIRYTLKQPTAKEQRAQSLATVKKCNAGKWAIAYRLLSTDERLLVDDLLGASTAPTQTSLPIPQERRQVVGDWSNDVSA